MGVRPRNFQARTTIRRRTLSQIGLEDLPGRSREFLKGRKWSYLATWKYRAVLVPHSAVLITHLWIDNNDLWIPYVYEPELTEQPLRVEVRSWE